MIRKAIQVVRIVRIIKKSIVIIAIALVFIIISYKVYQGIEKKNNYDKAIRELESNFSKTNEEELIKLSAFFSSMGDYSKADIYYNRCNEKLIDYYYGSGDFIKAYQVLKLTNDSNSKEIKKSIEQNIPNISLFTISKGEKCYFGRYEQDGNVDNGKEPVEWLCLDAKDNRKLLITTYALEAFPINTDVSNASYMDSSINYFLNEVMYNDLFSDDEKSLIQLNKCTITNNSKYHTHADGFEAYVFLLSVEEAEQYNCLKTDISSYLAKRGVNESAYYWLRTPGLDYDGSMCISLSGKINQEGDGNKSYNLIRPAIWIDVSSLYDESMGER